MYYFYGHVNTEIKAKCIAAKIKKVDSAVDDKDELGSKFIRFASMN